MPAKVPGVLKAVLIVVAILAIVAPLLVVRFAPPVAPAPVGGDAPPLRVVPPAEIPPVEPLQLRDLAPQDARKMNATMAFSTAPNPAARPYLFAGGEDDLARATDCLAAAVYYEAGDDSVGERAVAQVVLNRLRHPAFPKTVCGVVFQGSERSTGCQFTFTCDGALSRTPSVVAWRRARDIAAAALAGTVYAPVGYATHYHTDWVVPYWSSSLDKITEVNSHLFYRWTGWWGTPRAFLRRPSSTESPIAQLASLSDAHRLGGMLAGADAALVEAQPFFGRTPMALASDSNTFITSLNPAQKATFASLAQQACGERATCKFMGWTDIDVMPFTQSMSPEQLAAMSFSYIRDRVSGLERTLWNCTEFKQANPRTCMKRQGLRIEAPATVPTIEAVPSRGSADLDGVRRKPVSAVPAPIASPAP